MWGVLNFLSSTLLSLNKNEILAHVERFLIFYPSPLSSTLITIDVIRLWISNLLFNIYVDLKPAVGLFGAPVT